MIESIYYCHFTNEHCFSYCTAKNSRVLLFALWKEVRFHLETSCLTHTHLTVTIQTATDFDRNHSNDHEIIRILLNPKILHCSQEHATGEADESNPTFRVL